MRADQRGSVLLLVPAALLVLLVLAAITIDFSLVFLAEREVADAASAAANDAATAAIDVERFRATGALVVDCGRAEVVARESFAARRATWLLEPDVRVIACAADGVTVEASGRVAHVFGRALPGATRTWPVRATASARARRR